MTGAPSNQAWELSRQDTVDAASPGGHLHRVLLPLQRIPPRAIVVEKNVDDENRYLRRLRTTLTPRPGVPDHDLVWHTTHDRDLLRVFSNYRKRLPLEWVELLEWSQWAASFLIPLELPSLRHAYEALIEVEPQLHVDSYHPNRDHVVHQIGDACLAAKLLEMAAKPMMPKTEQFDRADWRLVNEIFPETARWTPQQRLEATSAGLALAGLTHDVGYIRYIGATARERLASVFGVPSPASGIESWDVARVFGGTLLDLMLSKKHGPDAIVVDLYHAAWKRADHGPLAAFVLASIARNLRLEGRSNPQIEVVLQIASASAFLHELHPNSAKREAAPRVVKEARRRIARFAWPGLFRIVDDLQCWFRPSLQGGPSATVDLGARGARFSNGVLSILGGKNKAGSREVDDLNYLRERGGIGRVFAALGIDRIKFAPT